MPVVTLARLCEAMDHGPMNHPHWCASAVLPALHHLCHNFDCKSCHPVLGRPDQNTAPIFAIYKKNENNPMANSMLSQSKKPPTRLATLQVFFLPHQPLAKHFPHHPTPSTPKSIHVTLNDKSWHRRIAKKGFHPPPVHAGSAHRKKYKKATSSFLSSDRMPLLAHLWKLRTTSSGHIQKYVANFAALTMFTICCTRSSAMWTCLQAGYPTSL